MFEGKVGLVTGGASGLGEAAVRRLADEGATVVVADIDDARGADLETELESSRGTVRFLHTDVTSEEDTKRLVDTTVAEFGRLDFAINNAGYGHGVTPLTDIGLDTFEDQVGVNLRGTFLCMRAEITQMLENGGGSIVNVASIAGIKAVKGTGAYGASKAGIVAMSRTAALDYVRDGIRVNVVSPGAFLTPLMVRRNSADHWAEMMPCGRLGEPRELANALIWLASDEASYVSGIVLPVDYAASQA